MGDEEARPPRFKPRAKKLSVIDVNMEDMKRHPEVHVSPMAGKSGHGIRSNCLCSPTTHPGSFRCRQHRVALSGMFRGSSSVGSNLSLLGEDHKPPQLITDSFQPHGSF